MPGLAGLADPPLEELLDYLPLKTLMNRLIAAFLVPLLATGCTQPKTATDLEQGAHGHADATDVKYIALTYDDGPHAKATPALLDVLRENNAKATFFVLGSLIADNGQLIKRMDSEGHELGNHTINHPILTILNRETLRAEIKNASSELSAVTGKAPTLLRPPRAAFNANVQAVARENGLAIALFDIYPNDSMPWNNARDISETIVSEAKDGSIVFLHDTSARSVDATELAIRGLSSRGFRFVTLSELIKRRGPIKPGAVYKNGYVVEP